MDLKLKTGCDKGTNFDGGLLWKRPLFDLR
jgi:hypothetical protein